MSQVMLEQQVTLVVENLVNNEQLFTALDVSNKVKESLPDARHREVRDVVRRLFTSKLSLEGYAATPITVTLHNGVTAEALLYHPLADSWDLDVKYDMQKRSQVSAKAVAGPTPVVSDSGTSASVTDDGTVSVQSARKTSCFPKVTVPADPVPAAPAPVTVQKVSARDAWTNLFNSQPSLFPRKS
jgi:hypothetical protein